MIQLAFAGVEVAPPPPPPVAQKWAIAVLETLPVSTTSLTSKGLLVIQIAQVEGWDTLAGRLLTQGFKRDARFNYSKISRDKDRAVTWWAGFAQSWDDVAARAAAEAAAKRAAEPVEPPEVRIWIAERQWDRLDDETRTEFEEPIGGCGVDWEGREGWVTALVPDDEVLVALRGIAEAAKVKLHQGDEMPVVEARGRKAKAAPPVTSAAEAVTHRAQPHPCDAETRPGYAATIAVWQEADGGSAASVRTKGTGDHGWFEHVTALAARHGTVRVYSAAGECTWDSRDGAPPEPPAKASKPAKVKPHRQQPVPEADELAQRGLHVYAALVEGEWTRVDRKAGETAPAWEVRYTTEAAQGVRVRVYDGSPRCTWDSLDGAP